MCAHGNTLLKNLLEETNLLGVSLGLALLGQELRVDVGEDTALGNGDTREQLVELLVVADGELEVARVDARLLVVAGSVASELKDLGTEVLHDGGQVDRGAGTNALSVVSLAQQAVDTANGELTRRRGDG